MSESAEGLIAIAALKSILELEDHDGQTRDPSWRFNRALQIAGNAYRKIYDLQQLEENNDNRKISSDTCQSQSGL